MSAILWRMGIITRPVCEERKSADDALKCIGFFWGVILHSQILLKKKKKSYHVRFKTVFAPPPRPPQHLQCFLNFFINKLQYRKGQFLPLKAPCRAFVCVCVFSLMYWRKLWGQPKVAATSIWTVE